MKLNNETSTTEQKYKYCAIDIHMYTIWKFLRFLYVNSNEVNFLPDHAEFAPQIKRLHLVDYCIIDSNNIHFLLAYSLTLAGKFYPVITWI